jgi:ketosteroid isomerase-like protein
MKRVYNPSPAAADATPLSECWGILRSAMSKDNVAVVLEGLRLFEASDVDGMARLWYPDVRVTAPEGWPEPGPFEGRNAVFGQFRRLATDWERQSISEVDVVADRAGWVVVTFRWEVQGVRSGVATATQMAASFQVTDGRISEAHFRWKSEQALAAAGLLE